MSTLLGIALVAATWALAAIIVIAIGLAPAAVLVKRQGSADRWTVVRHAIWWGLAITTILVLAGITFVPVSAPAIAIALLLVSIASGALGAVMLRTATTAQSDHQKQKPSTAVLAIFAVVVFAQIYWAWTALGPVTNYDSGLYHLGAVSYAADYSAIPGIANLYPAFGYATAQFPLAATFTHLGWGAESFRLINGFVLALVALDLLLRLRRRTWSPGTYFLLVMVTVAWVALIALADYWVTSPSQDTTAWLLTAVAIAYLMDALSPGTTNDDRPPIVALTIALVTTLVLVRSTLGGFAVLVLIVLAWTNWAQIRQHIRRWRPVLAVSTGVAVAGAAVLLWRDYLLSGWLLFPLDLLPTGTSWQAVDPAATSQAILGFHRDPTDIWAATEGWAWIPGWWSRAPTQWEFWAAATLWAAAVVLLIGHRSRIRPLLRPMLLSAGPVAGATAIWFLATPPSPRFAWGLIFGLPTVLLAWALWSQRRLEPTEPAPTAKPLPFAAVTAIAAVLAFSALFRADTTSQRQDYPWAGSSALAVALVPAARPPVTEQTLASGLTVLTPIEGELCWTQFPLCAPNPNPALRLVGDDLGGGLAVTEPN